MKSKINNYNTKIKTLSLRPRNMIASLSISFKLVDWEGWLIWTCFFALRSFLFGPQHSLLADSCLSLCWNLVNVSLLLQRNIAI